ncbi:reverse transcriptase [Plakobranchus ocellatus]|uniref:Reverse transcriptase n=1 Tax=Plakobranchus ocellatus TaxID=259542 RepID=A0AAV3YW01_9GAST|nr:reverse transcriptase [Plakobranchus ocellatus]
MVLAVHSYSQTSMATLSLRYLLHHSRTIPENWKKAEGHSDRRGLRSTIAKWWSKTEGKEKRDMIIDEIRNKEDSARVQKTVQQQGQWTNWDTAIQRSLTWNVIWHMAPLRISFLIRSVYDPLPSNANLVRWGKKD